MERIGKYIILEEIGRGGMGRVYKARDPVIERDVAIKVIVEQVLDLPEMRRRFYREARSAGRLAHENIVVVHDVGEEDGLPYIVMEYLEGTDLRETMAVGALSIDGRLEIALGICEGLRYAHARGVIHRDIKPENIRLVEGHRVKIVDFGIARLEAGTQTLTHASVGTPRYMSPEQIKGDHVDHRSDIFSFGVLFYELLTGDLPFRGDRVSVLIYKILNEEPDPIELPDPRLSDRLQRIVSRCLDKDLGGRYPNVGVLIDDLKRLAAARQETRTLFVSGKGAASSDETSALFGDDVAETGADSDADPDAASAPLRNVFSTRLIGAVAAALLFVAALAGVYAVIQGRGAAENSVTLTQSAGGMEGAADGEAADDPGDEAVADSPAADEPAGGALPSGEPQRSAENEGGMGAPAPSDLEDADGESEHDDALMALRARAEASEREMEAARSRVGGPPDDAEARRAYMEGDSLRRQGMDQFDSGAFAEAVQTFDEAGARYVHASAVLAAASAAGVARDRADRARTEMLSVKEAVPPVVHASGPYRRALALAEEGVQAYQEGDFDRAYDRYAIARGSFEEAAAPDIVVQAEAGAIQERLKQAIVEDEWGGVPPVVADGYFQHMQDLRRYWRITDVTLADQSLRVDADGATLTLPVTVTVHYVQPGGFDPGNYSLFSDWTWVNRAGETELDRIELIRTSR
jgi:serine/threonine-protein kinase